MRQHAALHVFDFRGVWPSSLCCGRLDCLSDPLILIRWCQRSQSTVLCHGVPTGNTICQHYICGLSLQDKAAGSWKVRLNSFHRDYFFYKNSSNENCSQWCLWSILSKRGTNSGKTCCEHHRPFISSVLERRQNTQWWKRYSDLLYK